MSTDTRAVDYRSLVLWPGVITLAVTLLRLSGELLQWSDRFFSRAAGGAAALVGIVWLVPVFGVYFALRLVKRGHGPKSALRAALWSAAGLVALVGVGAALGVGLGLPPLWQVLTLCLVAAPIGAAVAYQGWPALGKALLLYGLAARIPVALIMLAAIYGNWGTHYELGRPDLPPLEPALLRWFVIGLVPQLGVWIGFTIVVGGLFGAIAAAVLGRPSASAH